MKNCKSIKNSTISIGDINCIIGKNGSGKTNILKAIKYFYDNLTENNGDSNIIDKDNPYINYMDITFIYDFNRLIKITKKNLNRNSSNYIFKKIYSYKSKYVNKEGFVKVTLRQYNDNSQQWFPNDYEFRLFLKNTFPIYFINTRSIDLTNWNDIWSIIGEAAKIKTTSKVTVDQQKFEQYLMNGYGEKIVKGINFIKRELQNSNVSVKSLTSEEITSSLYKIYLNGSEFIYNEKELNYYSDGNNSFSYIQLMINLISSISYPKLETPLIVIDEPEIGLHPSLIDSLFGVFNKNYKKSKFLITTHSPRLIKNVIGHTSYPIYYISYKNKYTSVERMRGFTKSKKFNRISEKEASYYFSNAIVFVEGVTELELFSNKNILNLFPLLKNIEFYSYDSDNDKLKLIHPGRKKISIPYLIIVDMDKILNFEDKIMRFTIKSDEAVNPLSSTDIAKKESYYFINRYQDKSFRRNDTYMLRKRILGMRKKCFFRFDMHFGFINDEYFLVFKDLIKRYCNQYNIFPVDTTIEGSLINCNNYELMYEWLLREKGKTQKNKKTIEQVYNYGLLYTGDDVRSYRTTALRLLVDGKHENLKIVKDTSNFPKQIRQIYKNINQIGKFDKTSGWVDNFINFCFDNYILKNDNKIEEFKKYFGELYIIIKRIETLLEKQ
jgi:predicted ATP-dependent endonuclease of OLD family